jgi:hypothetical protein
LWYGARRQACPLDVVDAEDVMDSKARHQQVIGDDAAVTPPPYRLGTHDRGAMVARESYQFVEPAAKDRVGCGVISVIAKCFVPP